MRVFGHPVPDGFSINPFYLAMCHEMSLTPPEIIADFPHDMGGTDGIVFHISAEEVQRRFVEFATQPFVDDEIIAKALYGLRGFRWKFWLERLFGHWMDSEFVIALLACCTIFFTAPETMNLAFIIGSCILAVIGIRMMFGLLADTTLLSPSGYRFYGEMIESCKYCEQLATEWFTDAGYIHGLIERITREAHSQSDNQTPNPSRKKHPHRGIVVLRRRP